MPISAPLKLKIGLLDKNGQGTVALGVLVILWNLATVLLSGKYAWEADRSLPPRGPFGNLPLSEVSIDSCNSWLSSV